MGDNQWIVDVADIDEENCVIRIWNMHCPECRYDPLADTASSITIPGPERTENGTYFINALNVPKTFPTCPKCGKVLSADGDEKKKKTFLVEMDSAPIMGTNGNPCACQMCLQGPHPMCLITGSQVQNLDHCPVLREIDLTKFVAIT